MEEEEENLKGVGFDQTMEEEEENLKEVDGVEVEEPELIDINTSGEFQEISQNNTDFMSFEIIEPQIPLFKEDGLYTYTDALLIIKNARVTDRQITFHPPRKPLANGQVYVYALQDGQDPYEWRADGFQWANLRANSFPKKKLNPKLARHEFRLLDEGKRVDFYRHEYHEAGQKFKTPICLDNWQYPFIVIHYFGTFLVNNAKVAPHGNRKSIGDKRKIDTVASKKKRKLYLKSEENGLDILHTAVESIIGDNSDNPEDIEVVVEEDVKTVNSPTKSIKSTSRKIAKTCTKIAEDGNFDTLTDFQNESTDIEAIFNLSSTANGLRGPNLKKRCVMIPHSSVTKQMETYNLSHVPPLNKDDLYGCYIFQESIGHDKVLRALDFSNGSNIIIAEDNFLKHINCVLTSNILSQPVKFSYQPTARLYRFCISTLFIKHPIFENEPNIPVAVFLHRVHNKESHTRFFKTMKELIPSLNSSNIELTVNTENGVFPSAKSELTENPKIKSISTTTSSSRISSPKLDYVLVSVAKSPNCDHVKIIHLIYFLQCHFMNEITRSLLGNCEGDLLIQSIYDSITCDSPSLADRLLPSGMNEIEDSIGPTELITMLTRKPPIVIGSGSDYETCTRNELQLFEGLAHYFITKDRLLWLKERGLFSVKGLGGKLYNVKLSDRSCSCLRGKACEHVLAVLIGTGLLARHS